MKYGKTLGIFFAVGLISIIVDQITKVLALRYLENRPPIELLGKFLQLHLVRNPGAAFSLMPGQTWIFALFGIIFVVALPIYLRSSRSLSLMLAVGALWGGAVGNLIDRFIQIPAYGSGHVIDFIDYAGLFVGNVADIAIVLGAGAAVVIGMNTQEQQQ